MSRRQHSLVALSHYFDIIHKRKESLLNQRKDYASNLKKDVTNLALTSSQLYHLTNLKQQTP